jgi:hypothetical protein
MASLKTRLSRIWKRRFLDVHSAAMKINVQDDAGGLAGCMLGGPKLNEPSPESRRARSSVKEVQVRLASRAATVSLSASAVAEGGELLGEAATEGRHVCEQA